MGLLDGDLAAAFAAVFGGIYLDGSLWRTASPLRIPIARSAQVERAT
jgi:hypothetical protein